MTGAQQVAFVVHRIVSKYTGHPRAPQQNGGSGQQLKFSIEGRIPSPFERSGGVRLGGCQVLAADVSKVVDHQDLLSEWQGVEPEPSEWCP